MLLQALDEPRTRLWVKLSASGEIDGDRKKALGTLSHLRERCETSRVM
jgi:hypothetical protein